MPGGNSVGQIQLDLGLNSSKFNKQTQALEKATKKQFTGLTSFLSNFLANVATTLLNKLLSEMGNFVKSAIDLSSDLQEVENVVDTVFKNMEKEVDAFAQSAMESFGLSELVAKQYMGQLGAMAKAFGYTEKQSYDLARSITGLTGDVASFYNMTTDEAFTKLKAIFTGETESLKSLGIVMTQSALDAFALANGFEKTTDEMSEAEKVALRYKFVLKQLESAHGDFARTSDSWANQTRVLALQFDILKSILGEGFIVALTPVVQMLNRVIIKMQEVARAFTNLIKHIFGVSEQTQNVGGGLESATDSAGDLAENMENVEKSAEAAKKSILGFDEINKLTPEKGGGSALGDLGEFDWGDLGSDIGNVSEMVDKLSEKFIKAYDKFISFITKSYKAFVAGVKPILDYFGVTLKPLSEELIRTVENVFKTATLTFSKWMENHFGTFKRNISKMAKSAQTSFEDIVRIVTLAFEIFNGALELGMEDISTGISDFIGGITTLASSLGYVFQDIFATFLKEERKWIAENKEYLTQTLADFMIFKADLLGLIGQIFSDMGGSLTTWWEGNGKTSFKNITKVLTNLQDLLLNLWNNIVMPILETLAEEFSQLWSGSLKPLWENLLMLFSSIIDLIAGLVNNHLLPFVELIVLSFGPPIVSAIQSVISILSTVLEFIIRVISDLTLGLSGIIDFLTGVFTLDWDKAWGGITKIFKSWVNSWANIIETVVNLIINIINSLVQGAVKTFEGFINSIIGGLNAIAGVLGLSKINKVSFNAPKIPEVKLEIPELAEGGFVGRNQPTLAVIGDNKHEGEIVAPESKIAEAVAKGVAQAIAMFQGGIGSGGTQPLEVVVQIGDDVIVDRVISGINRENRRAGRVVITT